MGASLCLLPGQKMKEFLLIYYFLFSFMNYMLVKGGELADEGKNEV